MAHFETKEVAEAAATARATLGSLPRVTESLQWQGVPWRWTWVYRVRGHEQPWAYLVPSPAAPLLVAPMAAALLNQLRGSRGSRNGTIAVAPPAGFTVGGVLWATWAMRDVAAARVALEIIVLWHGFTTKPG